MKNQTVNSKLRRIILLAFAFLLVLSPLQAQTAQTADKAATATQQRQAQPIVSARKINPTTVEVLFADGQRMAFDFYGENIFRTFQDNSGGIMRAPEAKPEAEILVKNPRKPVSELNVSQDENLVSIRTGKVQVQLDKKTSLMKVTNLATNAVVLEEVEPPLFEEGKVTLTLKEIGIGA